MRTASAFDGDFPSFTSLPAKKIYITPSNFRNTDPGAQQIRLILIISSFMNSESQRLHREDRAGEWEQSIYRAWQHFLCCSLCLGGTEDVLSCLHSIFWSAFDPRSICIHKYWSCTPGRCRNKREGKEWVYQIWDRCRAWKENFLPLSSRPTVNHTASKRACLLALRLDSFHQDSSPVSDLWLRAQKNRFTRSSCSPPCLQEAVDWIT